MNKKLITFIILSSFIFGGIGGWVLVRFVLPHLNSNRAFVRWNLLPQTAPIVITNQQVIHEEDGSDSIAAIQHAQPWVVGIVSGADLSHAQLSAAGIILTSDGLIATTKSALPKSGDVDVVFPDGTTATATPVALDSASDLAFIKANVTGQATASLGYPSQLELGQRAIVLSPSLDEHEATDDTTYISSTTRNTSALAVYSTDAIAETFGIDGATGLSGSAVISLDGNVEGIFDGTSSGSSPVITADTLRSAMSSYFANGKIVREQLGIRYQYTPASLASLFGVPSGAAIVSTAQPGLEAGDVITQVGGTSVSLDNSLESLLSRYASGQSIPLVVVRGKSTINVDLNATAK